MSTAPLRLPVLALLAAASPLGASAEVVDRFTGVARGTDGAVLYREEHEVRRDGDRLVAARTVYRDAADRTIAILRTDFASDPHAPSYLFEDLRGGAIEAVRRAGAELELRAGDRARRIPPPTDPARVLVAGQGLDRLVRARLAELARGTRLEVAYAIPARLDTYDMRVRALGVSAGPTVRLRAEFSSWVLRLLAPHLDVDYDRDTRRLLRYRGPSNLSFDGGENPVVEITYAYPPAAEEEGPRGTP